MPLTLDNLNMDIIVVRPCMAYATMATRLTSRPTVSTANVRTMFDPRYSIIRLEIRLCTYVTVVPISSDRGRVVLRHVIANAVVSPSNTTYRLLIRSRSIRIDEVNIVPTVSYIINFIIQERIVNVPNCVT